MVSKCCLMNFRGFGTLVMDVVEARIWERRFSNAGPYKAWLGSYNNTMKKAEVIKAVHSKGL